MVLTCGVTILLASVLAVGTFCTLPQAREEIAELRAMLNESQTATLNEIVEERTKIAFEGLLLGLAAALPFVLLSRWCGGAVVLFVVQSMYYIARPKTQWLLNHLNTRRQIDQWLVVYQTMRHAGLRTALLVATVYLIFGFVVSSFFGARVHSEAICHTAYPHVR